MRSKLIGALFAGVAAITLVGCGEEEKPKEAVNVYSNVDECKAEHSETDCTQAFEGAQKDHDVSAPHMTLGQCVDAYGTSACLPRRDNSGEYFVPAMAGFALGMLASQPVYHPVYVDLGGRAYYHSTVIGTYHPSSCYGCGHSTTVVHVYPSARTWSQSYARAPIPPAQQTARPSPPSYNYGAGASAPSERGGFAPRPASMAAPAAKTYAPSPSTTSYSAPRSSYSSPPSSSSSSSSSRGGFSSPSTSGGGG